MLTVAAAIGVALAVPPVEGSEPATETVGTLEIVPALMLVPKNRVAAMRMQATGAEGELVWRVVEEPVMGDAIFEGPFLYYVPLYGHAGPDTIQIAATDEAGNEAYETIDVSLGAVGACSHLGGTSGALALFGLALVVTPRRRAA
ncbi:MAG: hypothetical protein R3F61_10080 [Myxococcota bacterium]